MANGLPVSGLGAGKYGTNRLGAGCRYTTTDAHSTTSVCTYRQRRVSGLSGCLKQTGLYCWLGAVGCTLLRIAHSFTLHAKCSLLATTTFRICYFLAVGKLQPMACSFASLFAWQHRACCCCPTMCADLLLYVYSMYSPHTIRSLRCRNLTVPSGEAPCACCIVVW